MQVTAAVHDEWVSWPGDGGEGLGPGDEDELEYCDENDHDGLRGDEYIPYCNMCESAPRYTGSYTGSWQLSSLPILLCTDQYDFSSLIAQNVQATTCGHMYVSALSDSYLFLLCGIRQNAKAWAYREVSPCSNRRRLDFSSVPRPASWTDRGFTATQFAATSVCLIAVALLALAACLPAVVGCCSCVRCHAISGGIFMALYVLFQLAAVVLAIFIRKELEDAGGCVNTV